LRTRKSVSYREMPVEVEEEEDAEGEEDEEEDMDGECGASTRHLPCTSCVVFPHVPHMWSSPMSYLYHPSHIQWTVLWIRHCRPMSQCDPIHSLFRLLTLLRRLGTHSSPSRSQHPQTPRATIKAQRGRRPLLQAGEDRHGSRRVQHQGRGGGSGEGTVGQGPEGEGGERGGER
jgi:hypothetical protein